ncbi:MAG: DUF6111 family protein [Alphaproteobacteria bacterium]
MIRVLLTFVVPLLAPTVLYLIYVVIANWLRRRSKAAEDDQSTTVIRTLPWLWLAGIGVVLTIISAVWFADFDREPPGGTYVPPQLIDGRIVPGHVVPTPADSNGD